VKPLINSLKKMRRFPQRRRGTVTSSWDSALPLWLLRKKRLVSHFPLLVCKVPEKGHLFSQFCISFQQQYCGPEKGHFLFTDPTNLDWVVSSSFVDLACITQLIREQIHFDPEDKGNIFHRSAGMHLKYYLLHSSRP
jgi:hypothetical protein